MRSLWHLFGAAALVGVVVAARPAHALDPDDAINSARQTITHHRNTLTDIQTAMRRSYVHERSAAQRLADGDLLLRTRDFERAAMVYNQIIDKYPGHQAAYAEASFMLGEAYYRSGQMLSAQRAYNRVVEKGSSGRLAAFRSRVPADGCCSQKNS
ncbi:MAG: hypothetical protein CSA75_05490 [Sorangium cellulosum]|nr:MAG: hypothetical protein CSA75_05490 [Sorangium cellulosum]